MSLLGVWLSTFGVAVFSAVIPVINMELYLLGASALAPRAFVVPLVVAASVGQVLGKLVLYFVGAGVLKLPGKRWHTAMEQLHAQMERHPRIGGLLVFTSASVSLPPFLVMSLAAGAARMNLPLFLAVGFAGRLLRFAVIVAVPQLVKGGFHF